MFLFSGVISKYKCLLYPTIEHFYKHFINIALLDFFTKVIKSSSCKIFPFALLSSLIALKKISLQILTVTIALLSWTLLDLISFDKFIYRRYNIYTYIQSFLKNLSKNHLTNQNWLFKQSLLYFSNKNAYVGDQKTQVKIIYLTLLQTVYLYETPFHLLFKGKEIFCIFNVSL